MVFLLLLLLSLRLGLVLWGLMHLRLRRLVHLRLGGLMHLGLGLRLRLPVYLRLRLHMIWGGRSSRRCARRAVTRLLPLFGVLPRRGDGLRGLLRLSPGTRLVLYRFDLLPGRDRLRGDIRPRSYTFCRQSFLPPKAFL